MWKKFFIMWIVIVVFVNAKEPPLLTQYGEIAAIYVATFNRAPDSDGLDYWVYSGNSQETIARAFFNQPEMEQTYPSSISNEEFVSTIYNNVFNRDPDAAGLLYWSNSLDSGEQSRDTCILATIKGAQGDDNLTISSKATVGIFYAFYGFNDVDFAKEVMVEVTEDLQTVFDARNMMYAHSGDPTKETSCVGNVFLNNGQVHTACLTNIPVEQCLWGDMNDFFLMAFPVYGNCVTDLHYPKESEEAIDGGYIYKVLNTLFWGVGKSPK
jgi:hypothetical protein